MDIHPFPWHLTPMFHSNGTGVIPQQGMVITQTSTTLLSTPQNQRRTGQWANSALQLSFSNRKKSLKHFFFGPSVGFLLQCCWLSSSPALLGAAAQPQRSDALRDSKTLPAALSALLKQLFRLPRKSSEDGDGGITSDRATIRGPAHCKSTFSQQPPFTEPMPRVSLSTAEQHSGTWDCCTYSSAGVFTVSNATRRKSQVVPSFKEQVPEDPTWEPKTRAPDWGKRPMQAQTGKPHLMDIFAPQHKPSLERLSEG